MRSVYGTGPYGGRKLRQTLHTAVWLLSTLGLIAALFSFVMFGLLWFHVVKW